MIPRAYLAIDLKSFYASVECHERGLDPLGTNLVVADKSRSEKTICLAVSPALKECGVPGRPRLFEVIQRIREVNRGRALRAPHRRLVGESTDKAELTQNPSLAASYIIAVPRMALYIDYSARIYAVYLRYVAPEDIHVYSIDEVFIDVTDYLLMYHATPHALALRMIRAILRETGITATAGIGTNPYLAKIAMDIVAKHMAPDRDGVRIAELDERRYREQLWAHRPLTDFWRVGRGYAKKLIAHGLLTMGDIARCSLGTARDYHNEDLLYRLFGVNAELLIDHAWGYEPCTMADIKAYEPKAHSMGAGQVLQSPYSFDKARIVVREMAEQLALDLVEKRLVTDQITLTIGYSRESLANGGYDGATHTDHYGRTVPKAAHGSESFTRCTASSREITARTMALFIRIANPGLLVHRITITASHVQRERSACEKGDPYATNLFAGLMDETRADAKNESDERREKSMQEAILSVKQKYGKNALLRAASLQEGATAIARNNQIGGHRA